MSQAGVRRRVYANAEEVADAARDWFVDRAREAISQRGRCLVALSGGSTPKRLYELLAELPQGTIDWPKVELFFGDERDVAADHPESNYRMVRLALIDRLATIQPRVYPIPCGAFPPEEAAHRYEELLHQIADGPNFIFDVIFLGLGNDAHTASLFPGTRAIHEHSRWVVANEVPQLKTWRVTMTAPLLNAGRDVAFLVCGGNKRWALDRAEDPDRQPNLYPVQLIQPAEPAWWFLDAAAETGS